MKHVQKHSFFCAHIDKVRFQKSPFFSISTFHSAFKDIFCSVFDRFGAIFVQISVKTVTRKEILCSLFFYKWEQCEGCQRLTFEKEIDRKFQILLVSLGVK